MYMYACMCIYIYIYTHSVMCMCIIVSCSIACYSMLEYSMLDSYPPISFWTSESPGSTKRPDRNDMICYNIS